MLNCIIFIDFNFEENGDNAIENVEVEVAVFAD